MKLDSGVKWVLAIIIIYTTWYIVAKKDESAATWFVVLILLSAYTFNRNSINPELRKLGLLK
jgi:hypothetical protein